MIELFTKTLIAYFFGNIMGGQIVGRLRGGVDLRKLGSGNVGATNALRTQGKWFALAVLLIDVLKGVLAVTLLPAIHWRWPGQFSGPESWTAYFCGVAVAAGHCYPVLYGFKGGKGVATLAGVFGALLPLALPWMLGAFILVVLLTGYVSLATLTGALVSLFYITCSDARGIFSDAGAFTLAMSLLVAWKHRENIVRLAQGREHRFEKARILGRWLSR